MIDFLERNKNLFVDWSLILAVLLLVLVLLSALYFYVLRKEWALKLKPLGRPILFVSLFLIWLSGLILYTIGFYRPGLNFVSVVPNAIIAAFKMFLMQHQLGRVDSFLQEDVVYMSCFVTTHFIATLMSVMFIMKLIGFRIKMAFKLWILANFRLIKEKTVNVFWGMNEASYLLAESTYKEKKKKNEYIFINTSNDDYEENKITLSSLFDVMNIDSGAIRRLGRIGAYVANCNDDIVDISSSKGSLFRKLRLNRLSKIIKRSRKTRFFFLSEDENYNVNAALKLMKDKSVSRNNVTIYVHALGERMNEIYNHYSMYSGETTKLKVVDSSYLSVTKLKLEPSYHPVNFVELDAATATVSSKAFNSLILGVGETGMEAFQYLYEFASFVDADGKKVPFKCYMLDKSMNGVADSIRMRMPAIKEDELELHTAAVDSSEYWSLLDEILSTLNYVVVALNDDDLAMYAAMEIYKRAAYLRNNRMKHFGIFVRCYDAQNYSRMLDMSRRITDNNKESHAKFVIFGRQNELYTYDLVIRESLLKHAMAFHKSYDEVESDVANAAEAHWEASFGQASIQKKVEAAKQQEAHCSKWFVIHDFIRQKEQNLSNSLHMPTKYKLLGIDKNNIAAFKAAVKTRLPEKITYHSDNAEIDLKLLNLAKCEHIRWESSHKLLGYVCGEKSLIRKQHPCLVPWDELSELMQSYDCNVVDTTIRMYGN